MHSKGTVTKLHVLSTFNKNTKPFSKQGWNLFEIMFKVRYIMSLNLTKIIKG